MPPLRDSLSTLDLAGSFRMSAEGRLVECNDHFARILGYADRAEIRTANTVLIHDPVHWQQLLARLHERSSLSHEELCLRRKDGLPAWTLAGLRLIDAADGQVGLEGILFDITARKELETELAREREFLDTLMAYIPVCIYFKDSTCRFTRVNKAQTRNLGLNDPVEAAGTSDLDYFPAELARQYVADEKRIMQTGQPLIDKLERQPGARKDGLEHWFLSTKVPIPGKEGGYEGILGVSTEITERVRTEEALAREHAALKEAEIALLETNQTLAALFEASPVAIYSLDAAGIVRSWNRAAELLFGWHAGDVIGRTLPTVPDNMTEAVNELSARVLRGELVAGLETQRLKKDGKVIDIDLSVAPIRDSQGGVRGIMSVAIDSSQRHRLEEQLRQSQKMEAIGRLAGGVAHELNNQMTVVTGHTHLLLASLDLADPARDQIEAIQKAGDNAATITRQLLAFGRRQLRQPRLLNLNTVVSGLDKMLRPLLCEDIALSSVLEPALWPVKADPGQIEQVLLNLFLNARDAMPEGGKLVIETRNVELDRHHDVEHPEVKPGPYVMLAVSDTGCGMDDETRAHIFEPFFTTKEIGKGTGLGLATVYGIVMQNDGTIAVESTPAVGSTFRVYLPRSSEATATPEVFDQTVPVASTETILIVEDEIEVRHLLRAVLRKQGHDIMEASGGAEAVRLAEQHAGPIHLVITDVVMPNMSGAQMVTQLLTKRPHLKVLYLSGHSEDVVSHHGVQKDAAFIQKPFSPQALARKVRELLDQ